MNNVNEWLKWPEVNSDEPVYEFEDIVPYGTRITDRLLRQMIARASPSRNPVRAKKKRQRVPTKKGPQTESARRLTPAEIEDVVYNNPRRPTEGVDADWLKGTLNCRRAFKNVEI